ncbi:hypothetical protein ACH3XW_13790 [Acanthocheilonema viteae]
MYVLPSPNHGDRSSEGTHRLYRPVTAKRRHRQLAHLVRAARRNCASRLLVRSDPMDEMNHRSGTISPFGALFLVGVDSSE